MAISYLFRFALISVSICFTGCHQGVVALVPAQQDEYQETEASRTHSRTSPKKKVVLLSWCIGTCRLW